MPFVVIDYHKGNLASVARGIELAGAKCDISDAPQDIARASALVLPGVGSFADASEYMHVSGQATAIVEAVRCGVPFLGICLGLQLLFERGNEGAPDGEWADGLGLLGGYCRRIDSSDDVGATYKVPHVGWNQVRYTNTDAEHLAPLFTDVEDGSNFYFTHSYQAVPASQDDILADVIHAKPFTCAVRKERVFGVQFHPEKSSHKGLQVLKNFVNYVGGLD